MFQKIGMIWLSFFDRTQREAGLGEPVEQFRKWGPVA